MTENEFMANIQDEITSSGALPVVLDEREIQRIIKQQSRWAFENYGAAVESQYYVIPKGNFNNSAFKEQRMIQMPDCVVSIYECKEVGGLGSLGNKDKDFSMDRLVASEVFLSNFTGDDLVMRTAQLQFLDLTKSYTLSTVAYDFNRNTHKLRILGRTPDADLFLNTYVKIPMDRLFDDYFFLRLCTAYSKVSYARILGTYPFQLPGGVSIDSSSIRSEGENEIAEIKQTIDNENSPDWFMIWH